MFKMILIGAGVLIYLWNLVLLTYSLMKVASDADRRLDRIREQSSKEQTHDQ